MASIRDDVKALLESRSEAVWEKNIDLLMSFYSSDIIYFDLVPPLRYLGAAALRVRFLDWFGRFDGPIGQEIRDLSVSADGDVAVASMLIRASGTLIGGRKVDYWVRATDGLKRTNLRWAIMHEHISLPVDLRSATAAMDLMP